jgi:ABC-type sugar transport system permease subunit
LASLDATTAAPRVNSRVATRRHLTGWLFLVPSAAILLGFVVWPIVESLWMSLHDWSFLDPVHPWVGLGNYTELVHDERFWNALRNTIAYTVPAVALQVLIGLALAVALQANTRFNRLLRSAYFFPVISSIATMSIVWKFTLDPDIGWLSHWLERFGLPATGFLQSTTWAMPTMVAIGVWKNVGFTMVLVLAGLQGIPNELYEASATDGAGRWSQFRNVTLPGLRPSLLFACSICVIGSLQLFDQVYVMTGGGPLFATETLVTYLYARGFVDFRIGYASAIAWILFLLILVASMLQLRLFRYRDED